MSVTSAMDLTGPWYYDPVESQDVRKMISKEWKYLNEANIRWIQTSKGAYPVNMKWKKLTPEQLDWVLNTAGIVPFEPITRIDILDHAVWITYRHKARRIAFEPLAEAQSTAETKPRSIELVGIENGEMTIETISTGGGTAIQNFWTFEREGELRLAVTTTIYHPALNRLIQFRQEYLPYQHDREEPFIRSKKKERTTRY